MNQNTIEIPVAANHCMFLRKALLTWKSGQPLGIALMMTLDGWVGITLWMLVRRRPPRAILAVPAPAMTVALKLRGRREQRALA